LLSISLEPGLLFDQVTLYLMAEQRHSTWQNNLLYIAVLF
jgi:hypothetical protein